MITYKFYCLIKFLVHLHPFIGFLSNYFILLSAFDSLFLYFLAIYEYLFFFFFYFISLTVPCKTCIVIFSRMFIYSVAVLFIIHSSFSILSYAICILCLNSFSTHSFLSLFHRHCNSFFISFYSWSIFT